MEKYVKPELEVIRMDHEDTILTSGSCEVILAWNVSWQDASGNTYTNSGK